MKKPLAMLMAIATAAALPLAATAQQVASAPPNPGESALDYAKRVDACNGRNVLEASFIDNGTRLQVRCAGAVAAAGAGAGGTQGLSGGLGLGLAAGGVAFLAIAAAAGEDNTTTTTTSN
ncbi:MAG: hypothetical protein Kow0058_07140 [Roseovarius sp.]